VFRSAPRDRHPCRSSSLLFTYFQRPFPSSLLLFRTLLPLAEVLVQVKCKIDDGTLIDFVSASPLDPHTVKLGVCKLTQLLSATAPCLLASALSLNYFIENKVDYVAATGLTKEEYMKIISVATILIALLTRTDGGLQTLASRLLQENDEECRAVLSYVSRQDFQSVFDSCGAPMSYTVQLLGPYRRLPGLQNVVNLSTLPRPPLFTDSDTTKAAIKLSSLTNTLLKSPLCNLPDVHIFRYLYFTAAIDFKGNEGMASAFWAVQVKDDLFTMPFAIFIDSLKHVRTQVLAPPDATEKIIPKVCHAVVHQLTTLPFESCSNIVASLSTPIFLKKMESVGLYLLQESKDPSLERDKKAGICIAATILLSFRTFIDAKQFSAVPVFLTQMVTRLPEPSSVFNSMKHLSHAWVECAHCLVSMGAATSEYDYQGILSFVSFHALFETGLEVMQRFSIKSKSTSTLDKETLIAVFTAQEAISTIMATAGWVFASFSHEENFGRTKKVIFDVINGGIVLHRALAVFISMCIKDGKRLPKSAALCEAAIKSVEAASKALLWIWKISPRQIVQVAQRCPNDSIPSVTMKDLIEMDSFSNLHKAISETLKVAFMCCRPSVSAELAGRIGATSLKAFHAMEINPHKDWLLSAIECSLPMNVSELRAQSYPSILYITRDPTPPFEKSNAVFETAIMPILANPVPWLENAAKTNVEDSRFGDRCVELSKQDLKKAMKDVVEGGEVQKQRAVSRAHAMATLQCGYVGCRTIALPNEKGRLCSGCKVVRYCSETCSKADWKKHHKIACKAIAAGAKA